LKRRKQSQLTRFHRFKVKNLLKGVAAISQQLAAGLLAAAAVGFIIGKNSS